MVEQRERWNKGQSQVAEQRNAYANPVRRTVLFFTHRCNFKEI